MYRNGGGAATGWSENIPLCFQLSDDEGGTWSAPCPTASWGAADPSAAPHGVEPKAAVVGAYLVVAGGRDGLFAWVAPTSEVLRVAQACSALGTRGVGNRTLSASGLRWQTFNIAHHHNAHLPAGSPNAFSDATLRGTGGGSETTGYMGMVPTRSGDGVVITYDRTQSHYYDRAATNGNSNSYNNNYSNNNNNNNNNKVGNEDRESGDDSGDPTSFNIVYSFTLRIS